MNRIDYSKISISELAALVSTKFAEHHLKTILVGGACVSIYSHSRYLSYDLDFVTYESESKITKALLELGFKSKGKHFVHPDCPFYIEFVAPPVTIGHEIIREFGSLHTSLGQIQLLSPTDCVKDRLASFFHWQDRQALKQAIMVCQDQKVDLQEIKRWAKQENQIDKLEEFLIALKRIKPSS